MSPHTSDSDSGPVLSNPVDGAATAAPSTGLLVPSGLSALSLKVIALVLMITEHAGLYFGEWLPNGVGSVLEYPGRVVSPIFMFLMVESLRHTRSRKKYLTRLWVAAGLMTAGNLLISSAMKPISSPEHYFVEAHNIFLMLAVAASVVACWDAARAATGAGRAGFVAGAVLLSVIMLATEGGLWMLPTLYAFYLLHDRRWLMLGAFAAYSAVLAVYIFGFWNPYASLGSEAQWAQAAAIPLIALYSGLPGKRGFKWLFYLAYPAHLWIFYAASNLMVSSG